LIRVPEPTLENFTIDYSGVELLNFEKGGVLTNSAKIGEEMARDQLEDAELRIRENILENQDYYQMAQESTEKILKNLIEKLNPDLQDLNVEVEFID
jgi:hypothetical protein